MNAAPLFASVFLASSVEAVEATTIVLASGIARDWKSSLTGAGAALVSLAVMIVALGPAISRIPLDWLRLVVGAVLLWYGLVWLRKAVLRASGYKALHDEAAIYQREVAAASALQAERRWVVEDWAAFRLSFNGVLLEGLEIVIIVLTFGANAHHTGIAGIAAGAAAVVVAIAGVAVRAPLTRVPENSLKFVVGVMLTSFGLFWTAEGARLHWPGDDKALLVVVPSVLVLSLVTVAALRYKRARSSSDVAVSSIARSSPS